MKKPKTVSVRKNGKKLYGAAALNVLKARKKRERNAAQRAALKNLRTTPVRNAAKRQRNPRYLVTGVDASGREKELAILVSPNKTQAVQKAKSQYGAAGYSGFQATQTDKADYIGGTAMHQQMREWEKRRAKKTAAKTTRSTAAKKPAARKAKTAAARNPEIAMPSVLTLKQQGLEALKAKYKEVAREVKRAEKEAEHARRRYNQAEQSVIAVERSGGDLRPAQQAFKAAWEESKRASAYAAKLETYYGALYDALRSKNPRPRRRTRRNPEPGAIYSMFIGKASDGYEQATAPNGTPNNIDQLAEFVDFDWQDVLGRTHRVELEERGYQCVLAATRTPSGHDQLYCIAVNGSPLPDFRAFLAPGDHGWITQVTYRAQKPHLGDEEPELYFHDLGEETGKPPIFHVNQEGHLIFKGGEYWLEDRGIVN